MKKSFTWLFSLVMFLGLFSFTTGVVGQTGGYPSGAAYTETTDMAYVVYPEDVVASTGKIRLENADGPMAVINADDSRVTITGDTVWMDLSAQLEEYAEYTVTVDADAFEAADGDPESFSEYTWSWWTGDYTAPTLEEVIPIKDATVENQSGYSLIMVFADEGSGLVQTANAGNVSLYREDGNIWDLIDVSGMTLSGDTLTLTGLRPLENNTNYAVTIDAGIVTDMGKTADGEKNPYAGLTDRTTWVFSSADFTLPGLTLATANVDFDTDDFDVVMTATAPGTVYYSIYDDVDVPTEKTVAAAKLDGTSVELTEGALSYTESGIEIYDSGVTNENDTTYVYAVLESAIATDTEPTDKDVKEVKVVRLETDAPTLSNVVYYNGTDTVANGSVSGGVVTTDGDSAIDQTMDEIVLEFDEEVKVTGPVTFYTANNDEVASVTGKVDSDDKTLVTLAVPTLANNTTYYVKVPGSSITDLVGNEFAGITSTTGWRFDTDDVVSPKFVSSTPADGAVNVDKDVDIVVEFDELLSTASGFVLGASDETDPFIITNNATGDTLSTSITTSSNGGMYTTYTITPDSDLPSGVTIVVMIQDSSLVDEGGNYVEAQGFAFVVEDYEGPEITEWTLPAMPDEDIVIEFNEAVYLLSGGVITDANLSTILTLKEGSSLSGPNVAYTATIDAAKKVITITPDAAYDSETTYYVSISADLEDAVGNTIESSVPTAKTFTINDVTPATVDISIEDGEVFHPDSTFTLTFLEGTTPEARAELKYVSGGAYDWNAYTLDGMDSVIILKEGGPNGPYVDISGAISTTDDATFEIDGDAVGLESGTTYYFGVGTSTKGADGNINIAKFVTFSTLNVDVPEVVTYSPDTASIEVDEEADFVMTFNVDVALAGYSTGDIKITNELSSDEIDITSGELTVDDNVVTIDPTDDLSTDSAYTITVDAGVFENVNDDAQTNAAFTWAFTTVDTKIELAAFMPDTAGNNVNSVAIDSVLKIAFNEEIVIGTGSINIMKPNTGATQGATQVESIDVTSDQVTIVDDTVLVITPSALYKYDTEYYVETSTGIVEDLVGNEFDEVFGDSTWNFSTENPDLEIVSTTPADGTDKVAADAVLVVEFNREIAEGSGDVGYIEWDGSTEQSQTYPIGSSNVTISGKTLTIQHGDKDFPADSEIFFYLSAGSIEAATDETITNTLVDRTNDEVSFFTGNVNEPVPTFTPGDFAETEEYSDLNTNIVIEFDEDIFTVSEGAALSNDSVTNGGFFYVISEDDDTVSFTGTIVGRVVTLDPDVDLDEYTEYTIQVIGGKIQDAVDTVLASTVESTFKTKDVTIPVIDDVTLTGGNESFSVADIDITDLTDVTFYYWIRVKSSDAAPTASDIMALGESVEASGGGTVTISVDDVTDLEPSTTYEFFYIAVDEFENTTAVAVEEVETDDTVAPLLVETMPAKGAMDVALTGDSAVVVTLTFDEEVVPDGGNIYVWDYESNSLILVLDETALSSVEGDTTMMNLEIPMAGNLPPYKLYVEIEGSAIEDRATVANNFGGVYGDSIVFTTEDNEVPAVVDGTSGSDVALDSDIEVVFSEDVAAGSGTAILYTDTAITANIIEIFDAADAAISGSTAVLDPSDNFEVEQKYVLVVRAGFVEDLSSNANGNLADTTITFTATENVKPEATITPSGDLPTYSADALKEITVTFSENVNLVIANYQKPFALLSKAELMTQFSLVDSEGTAIPFTSLEKALVGGKPAVVLTVSSSSYDFEESYTFTATGFVDDNGLVMDDAVATYTTNNGIPPTITFNPADDSMYVAVNSALTLTFSEEVYVASIETSDTGDTITVNLNDSNLDLFVYLYKGGDSDSTVDFTATITDNKVITIVPDADLEADTEYEYGLLNEVKDIDGITLAPGSKTSASFWTVDTKGPEAQAWAPAKEASSVSGDAKMSITFNEPVVVGTGAVHVRYEDGTIFQSLSGDSLTVDEDNAKKINIGHMDFEPNTWYFVTLDEAVVLDTLGNASEADETFDPEDGAWWFTTSNTDSLVVTATSPNGDNTPRTVNLEVTFNYDIQAASGEYYIAVYRMDDTAAVYQVDVDDMIINGETATLRDVDLEANQDYYARIEKGAFEPTGSIKGNWAGILDKSWAFSTVDNIAPEVVTLTPEDDDITVDPATAMLMIEFNRDIALGTGMIEVRHIVDGSLVEEIDVTTASVSDSTLTIPLTQALEANTAYYVIVDEGAVTNTEVTADAFAGIVNTYTWNFTTGDAIIPPDLLELLTWTPLNDTIDDSHATFVMTFDDSVSVVADSVGYLTVTAMDSTMATLSIEITADMIDGNVVTVDYDTLDGRLDLNTTYVVNVDGGILENAAGYTNAAVTGTEAWTFTTGDNWATAIEPELEAVEFNIYPNPFNDHITITNSDKVARMIVVNIAGQRVMDVEYPNQEIYTGGMVSGVYVISLITEDGQRAKTMRMIKR